MENESGKERERGREREREKERGAKEGILDSSVEAEKQLYFNDPPFPSFIFIRLGPGRIHHCMRTIGMCERALSLMCERALSRVAFGKELAHQGSVKADIASSRADIDQCRCVCVFMLMQVGFV